jgi:hydrogenase maturation protease
MRIIGCGNHDRQDDAAGMLVAERLRALGIDATTCNGDPGQLMEAWRAQDDVILIDSVVTGAPVGTVHIWNGRLPEYAMEAHFSSHGLGVAEAISLAGVLDRLPRRLRIYGIEADGFIAGATVSPAVQKAAESVADAIAAESASTA